MKSIEAKVRVNADRTVIVQFPADMQLTVDVQMGEYDAVLVLNNSSNVILEKDSSHAEDEQPENLMTDAWEKWVEEVEQLPLSTNSIQAGDYQQHLVEKYRKQGLVL
jgi:predicted DNA-binding protein